MWIFKWVLSAILIVLVLGFAMQNTSQVVQVKIVNWVSPELALYLVVYISFSLGLFTWLLTSIFKILQLKSDCRHLNKKCQQLQDELNKLRNLSVEEAVSTAEMEDELD